MKLVSSFVTSPSPPESYSSPLSSPPDFFAILAIGYDGVRWSGVSCGDVTGYEKRGKRKVERDRRARMESRMESQNGEQNGEKNGGQNGKQNRE
jgi:hypothetical protein